MYEYKLQIGCMVVVIYFIVTYFRESFNGKMQYNKFYYVLLAIAPFAIFFDGATAWTVNHLDRVSHSMNLLLHCLFFLSLNSVVIILYLYTVKQTVGIYKRSTLCILLIPGVVAQILVIALIGSLDFLYGVTTNYSMGPSVIVCYFSLLFHGVASIVMLIYHRRAIERKSLYSILFFYAMVMSVLFAQVIWPEILISALFPALCIIGIYISFENPALKHLHAHNEEMIDSFATLVESRDNSTGGHIKRTRGYVKIILREMQKHIYFRKFLTEDYIQNVYKAAPMHDIGKIATPDRILQKPGKLTAEEYEIMKQHAKNGGDIIKQTFCDNSNPDYQKIVYEVARHHHEKWNGKGYPDGLKGDEIPLHARVMAIADVFDAVSEKRCYRDALPLDECFKIIEEGAGTDFDPELVKIFMDAKDKILKYKENEKNI